MEETTWVEHRSAYSTFETSRAAADLLAIAYRSLGQLNAQNKEEIDTENVCETSSDLLELAQ